MEKYYIYHFISEQKFPIREKYLSFTGNFNKNMNKRILFLSNHFNILLKKSKREQEICEIIKNYNLMLKSIEDNERKKIKKYITNKIQKLLYHQKIKSVSNNNMILDLMTKNTNFINYLKAQKKKRNPNKNEKSPMSLDSSNSISFKKKISSSISSPFLTEIKSKNNKLINLKKEKHNNLLNAINHKQKKNFYNNNYFSIRLKKSVLKKGNADKNYNSLSIRSIDEKRTNDYFKKRVNFILTPKVRRNHDIYSFSSDIKSIKNCPKKKKILKLKKSNMTLYKK